MRSAIPILALLAACGTDTPSAPPLPAAGIERITGGTLDRVSDGPLLHDTITVRVVDSRGEPVSGVSVTFVQDAPFGQVEPSEVTTGVDGRASAVWRLGGVPGMWHAEVRAGNLSATTFDARIRTWEAAQLASDGARWCVLDAQGHLACWTPHPQGNRPVPAALGVRFKAVHMSDNRGLADEPACAITTQGQLWCALERSFLKWPSGAPGSRTSVAFAPLDIEHPPLVKAGTIYGNTICGLGEDARVYCMGRSDRGSRGDGTVTASPEPVANLITVPEDVRFIDLTTGIDVGCALATDGAPWCWGYNRHGTIVPGASQGIHPIPVRVSVPEPLTSITQTDDTGICGLTADGRAICWGAPGTSGRVPYIFQQAPPAVVQGTSALTQLTASPFGMLALQSGKLIAWGSASDAHGPSHLAPLEVPRLAGVQFDRVHPRIAATQRACANLTVNRGTVCASTQLIFGDRPLNEPNPYTLRERPLFGLHPPVPVDSLGT